MTDSRGKDPMHAGRHDRLLREWVHDPYKSKRKPPEPTRCRQCGAVFLHGRWQWASPSEPPHEGMCPACHRIQDHVPAGVLTLSGPFVDAHRDEIMNVIHNLEEREKTDHPLKRVMGVQQEGEETVVEFTDPHLARGAGEALERAYHGELDYHYVDEDTLLRVRWHH